MKAGVKVAEGRGNFEVKDIDTPTLDDRDVLIEVKASSVCGTDAFLYEWLYRGRTPVKTPLVLGHEASGVIADLGKNVRGFEVGDKVVVEAIIGCGTCYYCVKGLPNLCQQWDHLGVTFDGTMAEYVKVPMTAIHRMPDNVSFEDGALVEPLSIAVRAMDKLDFSLGDSIAIIGPGTLGLLLTQAARSYGASKIIVLGLEKDRLRLEKAKALGADETMFTDSNSPVEQVLEMTDGIGADIVVEAGGTPESFKLAWQLVRGSGQVAAMGYALRGELEPIVMARQELSAFGIVASTRKDFQKALNWLEYEKVDTNAIISHRLGLDQAEEGIRLMRDSEATKVCLLP